MEEKELTDEEIVKAYFKDCNEEFCNCCPLGEEDCSQAVLDIINRQKEEIERLTEQNTELKKQVEELGSRLWASENAVKGMSNAFGREKERADNAVKDTAKEIYGEIDNSDILIVNTQEYGEIEVVPIERLKEIIKRKGVEVE